MLSRHRAALFLGSGAAALALATGCSSGTPHPAATSSTSSSSSANPVLGTKSTGLGTVVTDSNGFTLYRFDKDSNNPSMTTCTTSDGCASTWPPALTTNGDTKVQGGINQGMVATITRPDGTTQLTLGGWPLYRYAKDTAPGEVNGQAVGKTWYAATPEGKKAAGAAPAPAPSGQAPSDQAPADNGGGSGY